MINVVKPFLPDLGKYNTYLEQIWASHWLTNNGPLVNSLEQVISNHFQVPNFIYMANGTLALQLAIRALGFKRKVLTTPFSYIATASSLVWEGCTPVFVDIDNEHLNVDVELIEASIDDEVDGMLFTHVFGNSCNIDRIDEISQKYDLPVIYDSAHCWGTKYKGRSIFLYGDLSCTSFHATKLFSTVEGGGVFCNTAEKRKILELFRNFGHDGFDVYNGVGINAKNSEFHAAMGLAVYECIESIEVKYKSNYKLYQALLTGESMRFPSIEEGCDSNYSYVPIILESENQRDAIFQRLAEHQIFTRKYFSPSLNTIGYLSGQRVPVSENISKRILCLPTGYYLTESEIRKICRLIVT